MKRKIAYLLSTLLILASFGTVASAKEVSAKKNVSNALTNAKTFIAKEFKNTKDGRLFFKFKERNEKSKVFDENFNNLTLDQKKDLIKKHFEEKINNAVKNGRLTQDEANNILKEFQDKLNTWDGTSPFRFKENWGKKFDKKFDEKFDSFTLEQKKDLVKKHFEERLNFAVKNGKLTQEQADKMLTDFVTKLNNWDGKRETLREIKKGLWEQYKPNTTQSSKI